MVAGCAPFKRPYIPNTFTAHGVRLDYDCAMTLFGVFFACHFSDVRYLGTRPCYQIVPGPSPTAWMKSTGTFKDNSFLDIIPEVVDDGTSCFPLFSPG
jgi:hypothetical protein